MLAWASPPHEDATRHASSTSPVVDIIDDCGKGPQLPHEEAPVEHKEEGASAECLGESAAAFIRASVKGGVR